jgi:hypothetical protein
MKLHYKLNTYQFNARMTNSGTEKMLLDIYFVDQATKAAELEKIVSVPEIGKDKALSEVRAHLRKNKALTLRE